MNLQFCVRKGGALLTLDHTFAAPLDAFNELARSPAASVVPGAAHQAGRMEGRKSLCMSHEFSKRKILGFGTVVELVTTRGVWSEVGRVREVRVVLGKVVLIVALRRTRSRRASVGVSRLLDQVNI